MTQVSYCCQFCQCIERVQEEYPVNEMMAGGITWKWRFHFDQLSGSSGSSGPFQSDGSFGMLWRASPFSGSAG